MLSNIYYAGIIGLGLLFSYHPQNYQTNLGVDAKSGIQNTSPIHLIVKALKTDSIRPR